MLHMTSFGSPPPDSSSLPSGQERMITDFTPATADLKWYVLNDNVMGGRSEGDFALERGQLRFAGRTNTNGGGFSSIRTASVQLDLSAYAGIRVRVRGDGRRYTWRLASTAKWRGQPVSYWASFSTDKDTWKTIDVPFSLFVPKFRGYELEGPPLDTAHITGMGLMIYDGQDGRFEIRIDAVQAYSAAR